MLIEGSRYRSIWLSDDLRSVRIIDQRALPFSVKIETIPTHGAMAAAITDMHLRGAPLIGAAAAYGVYLACLEFQRLPEPRFSEALETAMGALDRSRPTAVNLHWALERQKAALAACRNPEEKAAAALTTAKAIAEADVAVNQALGRHGADLLAALAKPGKRLNVLTHCNAGWLATVDHGTATACLYEAASRGLDLHIWVDETRPRNQGALTAWELGQNGIESTVICDNAGGILMRRGLVDAVIVGTDRTAANGDVANKVGTYLKALAARDAGVPFYVALPSSSFDPNLPDGEAIPIEERDPDEVLRVSGVTVKGTMESVRLFPEGTGAANPAFDVTPARLVTAYITEFGVFEASELKTALGRCEVTE